MESTKEENIRETLAKMVYNIKMDLTETWCDKKVKWSRYAP
jgi:hypothetical protein